MSPFPFVVEAGKIREMADALGDGRDIFRSDEAARAAGLPAVPAPLVFTRVTVFQEPPDSTVNSLLGVDPSHMRHAGHAWTVAEPLYAGRVYQVTPWTITSDDTKQRRAGGALRFVTVEREFLREDGRRVIAERMITVVVGPVVPVPVNSQQGAAPALDRGAATSPQWHADWQNAAPGEILAATRFEALTRTDFVRYAGAIGDFTPIHHDPDIARRAGLRDVIAMGTLPVGLTLSVLDRGYGPGMLTEVNVRFHEALYAGLALDLEVRVGDAGGGAAPRAAFELSAADGTRILSGTVIARP